MGLTALGKSIGEACHWHDRRGSEGQPTKEPRFAVLVGRISVAAIPHPESPANLQKSPIQLGSIDLQDFEIPQSVRFGGRHRLKVHVLAGGRRVVERLGPDDNEIQFQGTFSGPTAEARARAFDNLRLSGEIVWLTWESFRSRVIVSRFIADYHSPWWIPYQISCVVVHQTRIAVAPGTSVAAAISADLSSAMSAAASTTISLSSIQAALTTSHALASGTADQTQAIAAVGLTIATIGQQVDQQSASLITPIASDTPLTDLGQAYGAKVSYAASLASSVNVGSYIGRIAVNIAGSSS
jgi:hypothetical protein